MKDKTFQTNVAFHSILLFTFLSIFFWLYITKVIVAALSDQVTGVIHKDIPMLVSELNSFVAFNRLSIPWNSLKDRVQMLDTSPDIKAIAETLIDQLQMNGEIPTSQAYLQQVYDSHRGESVTIVNSNHRLLMTNIAIVAGLFTGLGIYVNYQRSKGNFIDLKSILIENSILFLFIGAIEFLFFTFIVSKYVPASPAFMLSEAIDRIKNVLITDQGAL